jgi:predicted  nucleic acid-binding Zn-ribbon protein
MTLRLLHLFFSPFKAMNALLDRIVAVIAGFQSREADLRQRLADALADDAADEAEIAAARSDALAAMERAATAEALVAQLQASADDATSQLTAIDAFIEQFVPDLTENEANAEEAAAEPVDADAVDSSAAADVGADGDDNAAAGDASSDTTEPDQPAAA